MIWNLFDASPKSFIGVDIGTFSIKIVELSKQGNRKKLENYGEMQAGFLYEKSFRTFEKSTLTVSNNDVVKAIRAIMSASGIKTNRATFSIPDFSTFFTTFTLPPMTDQEIPQAVEYEARQHIPLPLSEVTLDWQVVDRGKIRGKEIAPPSILLVAVPNEVVNQYQELATAARLELVAMEAEVFALARALSSKEKESGAVVLIDLGARSTTVSIVDKGVLRLSHSFDTAGNDFTSLISKGLNLSYEEADKMKKDFGLLQDSSGNAQVRTAILPLIDLIISETKKIIRNFYYNRNKKIEKILLSGGSANMPGLKEYLAATTEKPVEIMDPFADIYYPPILETTLKRIGSGYSIALGAALRGFDN
jgi:type IV pilus assembly protein PilM